MRSRGPRARQPAANSSEHYDVADSSAAQAAAQAAGGGAPASGAQRAAAAPPPAPGGPLPPWEKVLWRRQPYPDNYTDPTFLQALVRGRVRRRLRLVGVFLASCCCGSGAFKSRCTARSYQPPHKVIINCHPPPPNTCRQVVNADVPTRDFLQVALGSAAITQQLSAVAASLAVAAHLRLGSIDAHAVLALSAAMLLLGYGVCCFLGGHVLGGSLVRGCMWMINALLEFCMRGRCSRCWRPCCCWGTASAASWGATCSAAHW